MSVDIEKIDKLILLGGNPLIKDICLWAKEKMIPVSVLTSPRQKDLFIDKKESLEQFLITNEIPFLITSDINSKEAFEFLLNKFNCLYLSIGAPWIFSKKTISSVFKGKIFNLHGTKLPRDRGGGDFSWQIMMGLRLGFCQLHLIDEGIDTGSIIDYKEFIYPHYCRTPEHYGEIYRLENLCFLTNFLKKITNAPSTFKEINAPEYLSTYWPRLNSSIHGWIDWSNDIEHIDRTICAFDEPYEGSKSFWNNNKVYIKNSSIDFSDGAFHPFQAGIVFRKNSEWISVCAGKGSLIIQSISDERGNNLISEINVGDRFFTPLSKIEKSLSGRITYTPKGLKNEL